MRTSFHEELKSLRGDVLTMGELTEDAIRGSVVALVEGKTDAAEAVIAGDDRIDAMNTAIEDGCLSVMATQCPVAGDLRLVHTLMFIASHLERMADLAVNIAKMAKRVPPEGAPGQLLELISEMGDKTSLVVHEGIEVFRNKDLELASRLPEMDEPIDLMFKVFFKELAKVVSDEAAFEWAANIVLSSRYLERIADHAVDIAERVSYMVTGKPADWN